MRRSPTLAGARADDEGALVSIEATGAVFNGFTLAGGVGVAVRVGPTSLRGASMADVAISDWEGVGVSIASQATFEISNLSVAGLQPGNEFIDLGGSLANTIRLWATAGATVTIEDARIESSGAEGYGIVATDGAGVDVRDSEVYGPGTVVLDHRTASAATASTSGAGWGTPLGTTQVNGTRSERPEWVPLKASTCQRSSLSSEVGQPVEFVPGVRRSPSGYGAQDRSARSSGSARQRRGRSAPEYSAGGCAGYLRSVPATHQDLKELIVRVLVLEGVDPAEIEDKAPLFGKSGLGLDSVDALELAIHVEEQYGVKISDDEAGRGAFASVDALLRYIEGFAA